MKVMLKQGMIQWLKSSDEGWKTRSGRSKLKQWNDRALPSGALSDFWQMSAKWIPAYKEYRINVSEVKKDFRGEGKTSFLKVGHKHQPLFKKKGTYISCLGNLSSLNEFSHSFFPYLGRLRVFKAFPPLILLLQITLFDWLGLGPAAPHFTYIRTRPFPYNLKDIP